MNRKIAIAGVVGIAAVISWAIWLKDTSSPKLALSAPAPAIPREQQSALHPPPSATTSPRQPILTAMAGTNFWARIDAAAHLPDDLTPAELKAIFAFLENNSYPNDEKIRAGERTLKNEILNSLHRQSQPIPDLDSLLIRMFRDKAQDPAIRDYALQHLATWAEQMISSPATQSAWSARKEEVRAVFFEAMKETGSGLAGTALINWHQLSLLDPSFASPALDEAALALAKDPQSNAPSKTAAIQICCARGLKAVLPSAKNLAQHAVELPLRFSAIAAVGALGEDDQLDFLKDLERTGELPVQTAARAAIQRVQRASIRSPSHTP